MTSTEQRAGRSGARLASRLDHRGSPYLFVSPYFLLFAAFGLFPLGFTLWVSLHRWKLAGDKEFVGIDNYTFLLTNERFGAAVVNTLGMFTLATVPQLLLALLLANALNKRMRGLLYLRMGVLIPMVTSVVAVAIVFSQLFSHRYGMINWAVELFGGEKIDWTASKLTSWTAIATMVDWRWTGYNAIIFLAAMQAIPRDLYEAAAIDGASPRRQFWQITVPQLKPVIIFTVFISTMGGLMLFAEPMMFGNGRLDGGTRGDFQTIGLYIVQAFRERNNFGLAAAAAWLLFVLILVTALVNYLFVNRLRGSK
ncbi:carbohydrate ABC transporter permease [Stackebrandtia nassauensis]|uniref:Binding-protein-dependent transport systems inner membrane component n=1 Tax=Stackebrandtia nassauensis (strain DSM 44728 / CIP 108903 / NRRL B-16338 / NBRC 102104 / LLR-40K-21) TaxID=446470 RepID=D3Q416_STANL|nr:sugar ABC transporter permease [Stackebrandtia nassauensis]ADD45901.1 binding-protein-dependent transport systems inner membrane component [Stackebrandtia nassauensis DSM 44728]